MADSGIDEQQRQANETDAFILDAKGQVVPIQFCGCLPIDRHGPHVDEQGRVYYRGEPPAPALGDGFVDRMRLQGLPSDAMPELQSFFNDLLANPDHYERISKDAVELGIRYAMKAKDDAIKYLARHLRLIVAAHDDMSFEGTYVSKAYSDAIDAARAIVAQHDEGGKGVVRAESNPVAAVLTG